MTRKLARVRPPVSWLGIWAGLLGIGAIAACSDVRTTPQSELALEPAVAREFERHGIRPTSVSNEFTETLPADLMATASWGTKVGPCRAGGYDLASAAGRPVRLLRFSIDERIRGEALYAFAVVDGDSVACVFRSVREDSEMAPGVFAASGD